MSSSRITLKNCRLCVRGELLPNSTLIFSTDDGLICERPPYISDIEYDNAINFDNKIIAPGFLELQTNGMRGFHFTHFDDKESYAKKVDEIARYLPSHGVTGFWATVPTVASEEFKKVRETSS